MAQAVAQKLLTRCVLIKLQFGIITSINIALPICHQRSGCANATAMGTTSDYRVYLKFKIF